MRKQITVVVFLSVIGVAGISADEASDASIRQRIKALEAGWNSRDAAAVVAVYAPDADLIIGDGPRHSGLDAIRSASAASWSTAEPNRTISISADRIRYLSPDVALADCTARFSAGQPAEDRATWVMVRRHGTWLVGALRVMPAERTAK